MFNLHIVRSPLQLINILEAIDTFCLQNNILVIIDRKSSANNQQIQEVLNSIKFDWHRVIHIKKASKSNLFDYVTLIKELQTKNFEHIFTGDIDSISEILFANLVYKKIFLVDDGTSTLMRHETLLTHRAPTLKERFKRLRFKFFGLKTASTYRLNFFTFFDITPKADEVIVKNSFSHLKKRFHLSQNYNHNIYILGQPLYNKEISEASYIEALKRIFQNYSDKKCIYVKHRYENLTEPIKELLKPHATIYENPYPIELDFLIKQEYPRSITGFFSTALYTLKQMFPEAQILAFEIESHHFFKQERAEVVANYYTFFKESGLEIHTIDQKA